MAERELVQERGRLAQLGMVQAFGEPLVDGRQQLAGFVMAVRGLPQSRQRDRGAQLERARALSARDLERTAVARLSRRWSSRLRRGQQEPTAQAVDLGFPVALIGVLDGCVGVVEQRQPFAGGARPLAHLGEQPQPVRPDQLGAGGELRGEPAAHLGHSLVELAL